MESSGNKFITPLLQTELIGQITTIREHLNSGNLVAAWFGLKTLYHMGLTDVQSKTKAHFDAINRRLNNETRRYQNWNIHMQRVGQRYAMNKILNEEVELFFAEISLALGPYLERVNTRVDKSKFEELERSVGDSMGSRATDHPV